MKDRRRLDRRDFLRLAAGVATGAIAAACAPATPVVVEKEVVKEVAVEKPVVVEKEVVKEVEKPVVVEKEVVKEVPVEKVVEKVVKETVVVEKEVAAPPEKVHIRYGTHSFGEQLPGFLTMMDKFNEEHPGIYVAVEAKPWAQYWQAIETQSVAGIAPDVMWSGMMATVPLIEKGILLDITDYIERDGIDLNDWFGAGLGSHYKGKYYGMPFGNTAGSLLWYNRTLFNEAGVDYPDETWNWNDFREAAKLLTKDTNGDGIADQWGMWNRPNFENTWWPLMLSNGGRWNNGINFTGEVGYWEIPDEPLRYFLADCPECVEALRWWQENICEFKLQPAAGEVTLAAGVGDEFAAGVVATILAGDHHYNRYKHITAFEYDITLIPMSPNTGKRMHTYLLMPNWVTTSTKSPDAAYELAKWCAMDTAQRMLGQDKVKVPTLKRAIDSYLKPPPDNIEVVPEVFEHGYNLATESFVGNMEVISVFTRELEYAYVCEKPIEQAAADADKAVNAVLAELPT